MSDSRVRLVARVLAGLARQEVRQRRAGARYPDGSVPLGGYWRPRAIRAAFEELGPFYTKVGQILSTRPDLVPEPIRLELGKLHDQVTPAPFAHFEPVLSAELGASWRGLLRDVDVSAPLGAASLAQVYRATLHNGRPVVVKVQRPGVRDIVRADMRILRRAVRLAGRCAPRFATVMDLDAMLGIVYEAMEPELDFCVEAANMEKGRDTLDRYPALDVPEVLHATPRVLIQSLAPGQSIRDAKWRDFSTEERLGIGRDLLAWSLRGYFVDRFFHADPHPGNIFVHPGEPASIIDWGMVGTVDRHLSLALMQSLLGIVVNDAPAAARGWTEMGRTTPWTQAKAFAGDLANIVPRVRTASLEDLDFGATLATVLRRSTKRGIATSPMIAILSKSFANMEGSVRYLAPELGIVDIFRDELAGILCDLVRESLSEAQAAQAVVETLLVTSSGADQARVVLRDLANKDLTLHIRSSQLGGSSLRSPAFVLGAAAFLLWITRDRRTPCIHD
ncbi:ABC1 kinase family protein [Spirillospora sp. NPDC048911]|uniref:ABC1 kinase family protein n=1 Tax=Spirillospora sp. NPDC048911 TaxID=3364527 RepID=UPI00371E02D4